MTRRNKSERRVGGRKVYTQRLSGTVRVAKRTFRTNVHKPETFEGEKEKKEDWVHQEGRPQPLQGGCKKDGEGTRRKEKKEVSASGKGVKKSSK